MPLSKEKKDELKKKYTDEEIAAYERIDYVSDLWDSIITDYSIPRDIAALAEAFKGSYFDISDPIKMSLLYTQSKDTGEFVPLGLQPQVSTKENMLAFLNTINQEISVRNKSVFDYSYLIKDSGAFSEIKRNDEGAVENDVSRIDPKLEWNPGEMKQPGPFKRWTNKWFGWFKEDIESYNDYLADKRRYDESVRRRNEILARNAVVLTDEKQRTINEEYKKVSKAGSIGVDVRKLVTMGETLDREAEYEKKRNKTIEVSAGRLNERIDRHENYQVLLDEPLSQNADLPMEGLALLAACSLEHNRQVADASTQHTSDFSGLNKLTIEEKAFMNQCGKCMEVTNVGAKILDSLYNGKDVARMGDRVLAVIASRRALNEAAGKYSEGDKRPLAELINDSYKVVYDYIRDTKSISNITGPGARAISEIVHALDGLLENDSELKGMVNISEKEMAVMRGGARIYELICNPNTRIAEEYKRDEGPETDSRREIVENELFLGYLANVTSKTAEIMVLKAEAYSDAKKNSVEMRAITGKYPDLAQKMSNAMTEKFKDESKEAPEIVHIFGKKDFNLPKLREAFLTTLRKQPEYGELMNMEKDNLFKVNFVNKAEQIYNRELSKFAVKENEVSKNLSNKIDTEVIENNEEVIAIH